MFTALEQKGKQWGRKEGREGRREDGKGKREVL